MPTRLSPTTLLSISLLLASATQRAGADEHAPVVRHLSEAIRFETVSHQDRSLINDTVFEAFLTYVEGTYPAVFSTLEVERVDRLSLLMRWPGKQSELAPVLFDAHYDVVPIEPGTHEDWTHPPFAGAVADGFIWGRGALDDKVAVIVTLDALESLVREGYAPERTLYFSFVNGEEIGGDLGAAKVAALLEERGVAFEYVVGEGGGVVTNYPLLPDRTVAMVALAEKTYLTLTLKATGTGGHSSTPPRDSSIVRLAKALTKLHENPFDARIVPPVDAMLRAVGEQRGGATGFALRNQWLSRPILLSQMASDPVGSAMVRTTTAVTMIDAGVKENVVPQRAEARVNFRILPDQSPESLIEDVEELVDDPQIEISAAPWNGNPGVSDVDADGYARIREAIETSVPDIVVIPGMLMATTDSRHYSRLTENVFRFHPMVFDVEDAGGVHGTNERVPVAGVEQGVAIYRQMIQVVGRP